MNFSASLPVQLTGPVVTVTANPAMDQTYFVDEIIAGGSHRVQAPLNRAGGKGLNVARVVHQSGHPTMAIAPVGGATGAEFTDDLRAGGVPHALVAVSAPLRRSLAFVDRAGGDTSIFNEYGHPLSGAEWQALRAEIDRQLPGAGIVVGSGSLPPGAPEDFYPALVSAAAARQIPCVIDTSGPALLAAAAAGADVLKPNRDELLTATGIGNRDAAARRLLELGAKTLLVSCGAEGMRLYRRADPAIVWHASLPALDGNPTGAGDAAVAAIAVVLAAGVQDPQTMLRAATAWSAAAVLAPAAGEIDPQYRELEDQVSVSSHPVHPLED